MSKTSPKAGKTVEEPKEKPQEEPQEEPEYILEDIRDFEEEVLHEEPEVELLSFIVGEEEYALYIADVKEIIKDQPITAIPRCPDYILGVISLRGEIIPIIDLKRRLGLGKVTRKGEPMIIVVHYQNESAGFLIELVSGILKIHANQVELTPEVVSPDKAEFLNGVVRSQDRLVAILNTDRLLSMDEDFMIGK